MFQRNVLRNLLLEETEAKQACGGECIKAPPEFRQFIIERLQQVKTSGKQFEWHSYKSHWQKISTSRDFSKPRLWSQTFFSPENFSFVFFSSENERWYSDKISGKWILLSRSQRRKVVARMQYQKRKISEEERRPRQSRTLDTPPSSTSYYKLLQHVHSRYAAPLVTSVFY